MKAYNGEIAARACFVRIGRDPDKDPELLAEIQRAIENGVNEARKFGTLAAIHAAQQAAIAAIINATEPIAIADEHDITSEEGYTSINENTRKAIVKARDELRAAKEAAGKCNS